MCRTHLPSTLFHLPLSSLFLLSLCSYHRFFGSPSLPLSFSLIRPTHLGFNIHHPPTNPHQNPTPPHPIVTFGATNYTNIVTPQTLLHSNVVTLILTKTSLHYNITMFPLSVLMLVVSFKRLLSNVMTLPNMSLRSK